MINIEPRQPTEFGSCNARDVIILHLNISLMELGPLKLADYEKNIKVKTINWYKRNKSLLQNDYTPIKALMAYDIRTQHMKLDLRGVKNVDYKECHVQFYFRNDSLLQNCKLCDTKLTSAIYRILKSLHTIFNRC